MKVKCTNDKCFFYKKRYQSGCSNYIRIEAVISCETRLLAIASQAAKVLRNKINRRLKLKRFIQRILRFFIIK